MLINNIKFIAQSTEPNPNEVDYWINTSVDPNGGLIMFHDGEAWHPVNEHHDLFQEELIKEEVERAKAAEAALDQKITTENNRAITKENALETQINEINELLVEEGDGTKFLANDGEYKEVSTEPTLITWGSIANNEHLILRNFAEKGITDNLIVYTGTNNVEYRGSIVSAYRTTADASYIVATVISNNDYNPYLLTGSLVSMAGTYRWMGPVIIPIKQDKSTTATSLFSLPITSNLVVATIAAAGSFSFESIPTAGKEIHVIINNTATSDVTVTLPTAYPYVCISGDSLTVPASGYAEVNAISDGTNIYLRAL